MPSGRPFTARADRLGCVQCPEVRSAPGEARRTLTRLLVIATIAVTLETLVFIRETGTTAMRMLICPTVLPAASVFPVPGPGWHQRVSWKTERRAGTDAGPRGSD